MSERAADTLPMPPEPPSRLRERLRRVMGRFVPDHVWVNWRWDMLAGLYSGAYQGCVWAFALQLARGTLRASDFEMGLAFAAPAVGYLFATLWARQMEGRSKLPFVTITWLLSRGAYLFTPLLVRGPYQREIYIALLCLTPVLFSVSTPAYTAIMKEIYPDELRGRLMSYVRIGMVSTTLLAAAVMGWLQEHAGLDFRWVFCVGGLFGVGTAYAFSRLRLPPVPATGETPPLGPFLRETFGILAVNHGYRWFTVSVFIAGFGNIVANTLYPIYQVDRFQITPTQIATMTTIVSIASLVSLLFWGWFLDRHGSLTAVLLAVSIICITPILYAVGPSLPWLYLAAACGGFAQAGVDLGYLNTTLVFAEPGRAAQYQAVHSTFFGLRGTIAPLLATPLLNLLGRQWAAAFLVCLGIQVCGAMFQMLSLRTYRRAQKAEKRSGG